MANTGGFQVCAKDFDGLSPLSILQYTIIPCFQDQFVYRIIIETFFIVIKNDLIKW